MRILVCVLIGVIGMTSCNMSLYKKGIKGDGNMVSKEISIDDYNSISISTRFDVVYAQKTNEKPYLRIEIDKNLVDYLSVNVKDSTLSINSTQEINPKHYKIYTNSTALRDISANGMYNIELKDSIYTNSLRISASGMGNITAKNILCLNLDVQLSGMGDINLEGEAINANIDASGKGNIKAYGLKTQNATCTASGICDIDISVSRKLSAEMSGIGHIYYKGNPLEKTVSKSGIGSIKAKD